MRKTVIQLRLVGIGNPIFSSGQSGLDVIFHALFFSEHLNLLKMLPFLELSRRLRQSVPPRGTPAARQTFIFTDKTSEF